MERKTEASGSKPAGKKSESLPPFLRSCEAESNQPIQGKITGEIPKWLKGSLLRNGAGLTHIGKDQYKHVFDGMALLHRFAFQDGHVTYQNCFLRGETYKRNMKAQRIVVTEFGTAAYPDPCKSIFQRMASVFSMEFTDNNLINVVSVKDEYYAVSETTKLLKIDPETLETIGQVDLSQFIAVNTATAHPHVDADGTVYNLGSSFRKLKPTYTIIKIPPTNKAEDHPNKFHDASIVASIPVQHALYPSYYHSFGITENYFVIVEQSYVISIPKMMKNQFVGGAIADCLQWRPNQETIFHLIRRDNGQVHPVKYTTKAFFFFHAINAYEENDCLVFDVCAYQDNGLVQMLYVDALKEGSKNPKKIKNTAFGESRRYVLPLSIPKEAKETDNLIKLEGSKATAFKKRSSVVLEHELLIEEGPSSVELPRMNYELNGKKYRYFYAVARNIEDAKPMLVKTDIITRVSVPWVEDDTIPGEPVFVPRPGSEEEDDGVVLCAVLYDGDENQVTLLVLDGKTFKEIGRATFKTPSAVPADFHGLFKSAC